MEEAKRSPKYEDQLKERSKEETWGNDPWECEGARDVREGWDGGIQASASVTAKKLIAIKYE